MKFFLNTVRFKFEKFCKMRCISRIISIDKIMCLHNVVGITMCMLAYKTERLEDTL